MTQAIMSDVGLTEKVKDSKLKFELWFRRHTSSTTYSLQSHSETVRNAWVNDIARLLWLQAIRNRELRLAEMTSMGMGSKTCLDLKTSEENRIENRAVNSSLLSKVARFKNSFTAHNSIQNTNFGLKYSADAGVNSGGNKRPHSLISLGSSSCSSNNSSLGGTAVHPHNSFPPTPLSTESGIGGDLGALEEHPDDVVGRGGESGNVGSGSRLIVESNPVTCSVSAPTTPDFHVVESFCPDVLLTCFFGLKKTMGKIKLDIIFSNDNGAFYAGQQLTGEVTVELAESLKIRAIKLKFLGEASVNFTDDGKRKKSHSQKEKYFEQIDVLFGSADSSFTGENPVLEAGIHKFPFVFNAPNNLPSSFESVSGYVRYWCKAYVHRPWKFDETTKKAFSIISLVDLNSEPRAFTPGRAHENRSNKFMCCIQGGISVQVKTERCAFVPGEEILITAEITNNSTKKIKRVEAYIQQNVIYKADTGSRFDKGETKIAQVTYGSVQRGDVQVWDNEAMIVPSLPPSGIGGCKLISVDYILNFVVFVESGENIHLRIPIVIGTLPLHIQPFSWLPDTEGHTQQPAPSAPPNNAEPSTPEYLGPPPTYEECIYMDRGDIQDAEDNQYTGGDRTYRPLYPIYATIHRSACA